MSEDIRKVVDQVFRLVYVVRNVAYYRSLEPLKDDFNQNYWIHIFNNFFDIAVLEWCKVFGSRAEGTHWSNYVKDQEVFRKGLLGKIGMSEAAWQIYWESIKNYRDELLAHHQSSSKVSSYPELGHMLTACYYYYGILIKELRALKVYDYPDNLEEYFEKSFAQAESFSTVAYQATKELKEELY
jgi:hypothetical protein